MSYKRVIAVDVMGGDYAPGAIIEGVASALETLDKSFRYLLVGNQDVIGRGLKSLGISGDSRIDIVHAEEVIGMDEHPVSAVRHKLHASINVAADLVKQNEADGLFSAGNTGAAVGSTFLKWRMLPGIERPAIATSLPRESGRRFLIIDAGATVDCAPSNLAQFAVMGDIYARNILKIDNPAIGILSNGTEVGKGNKTTQEAFNLIREIKSLNFVGNVEGHDLFTDRVDVVVCDGFVGNIALKCCEQLAKTFGSLLKRELKSKLLWSFGALLSKGAFRNIKNMLDPAEIGGAPLLGVNGICLIGHGISDARAVRNGLNAVIGIIHQDVNRKIVEQIHEYGLDEIIRGS